MRVQQSQHEVAGSQIVDAFDHAPDLICTVLVGVEVQIGITSIMADPDLGTIVREGIRACQAQELESLISPLIRVRIDVTEVEHIALREVVDNCTIPFRFRVEVQHVP